MPPDDHATVSPVEYHTRLDPHGAAAGLSDVILGGQDGLVNVVGVILGVAAASNDPRIVLAAGLATALAESVSMAAVAYTSTQARRAHHESEMAREHRHIRQVPELEREEIREIYRRKGSEGPLLESIVATITSNPDVWVAVMMAEEHRLPEVPAHDALRSAAVVGLAAVAGSLIPLLPFFFLALRTAIFGSIAAAGLSLFGVGAYKARTTGGGWLRSGVEMAAIGMAAAFIGYGVGVLFQA